MSRARRRHWLSRLAPALIAAAAFGLALGGCGRSTVDPASGEKLIRELAQQNGYRVKSVSCPSGINVRGGSTFQCNVEFITISTGQHHKGTVTVHITANGKQVRTSQQDVHVS